MKIKKYTNGAWTDLDKPVKKFDTYTDEATTLPMTIETSKTDAVENYQVYGASGGVGEETENVYDLKSWEQAHPTYCQTVGDTVYITRIEASMISDAINVDVPSGYYFTVTPMAAQNGTTARQGRLRLIDENGTAHIYYITNVNNAPLPQISEQLSFAVKKIGVDYNAMNNGFCLKQMMFTPTAPDHYIPYGYKIPILLESKERTLNLFNKDDFTAFADTRLVPANMWWYYESGCNRTTIRMLLDKNTTYSLKDYSGSNFTMFRVGFVSTASVPSANQTVVGLTDTTYDIDASTHSLTFVTPNNTPIFLLVTIDDAHLNEIVNKLVIVEGSVLPQDYIGYYASSNYDLFVGDSKLYADEYLDFVEQKVYRYVDGVLTPQDPPSPFPALHTYIGENNLSVDTTVQPEKVVLEYAGWKGIGNVKKYESGEWSDSNDI